jgi:hypothetical protein
MSIGELLVVLERFPWGEWAKRLAPGLSQTYRDLVQTAGKAAAASAGGTWDFQDPFLSRWMTRYVGERIVQLERTTKVRVAALIRKTFDEAPSTALHDLSRLVLDAVQAEFVAYEGWRAMRIARTERAIAANHGTIFGYVQAGVEEVEVSDGVEDDDCKEANGQIWTVARAIANPLAHPNCVRAFSAVPLADREWKRGGRVSPSFHRRRKQLAPRPLVRFVGAVTVPQWLRVVALERRHKNDSGNCAKMEQE